MDPKPGNQGNNNGNNKPHGKNSENGGKRHNGGKDIVLIRLLSYRENITEHKAKANSSKAQ